MRLLGDIVFQNGRMRCLAFALIYHLVRTSCASVPEVWGCPSMFASNIREICSER